MTAPRAEAISEILEVIRQEGAYPGEDARQLWRRMVFNVLVSNIDDHLRNHGFLWASQGWRLSPAYDMNPAPLLVNARVHVLALNEVDHTSSIDNVISVANEFGLVAGEAMRIAGEVAKAVSLWRTTAAAYKIAKTDIDFMAGAFEHDDLTEAKALGAKAPRVLTVARPVTKTRRRQHRSAREEVHRQTFHATTCCQTCAREERQWPKACPTFKRQAEVKDAIATEWAPAATQQRG